MTTEPRRPATPGGKITGNPWIRWHRNPNDCPHFNDDICPTCDFDGYYAATYTDCPWRTEELTR